MQRLVWGMGDTHTRRFPLESSSIILGSGVFLGGFVSMNSSRLLRIAPTHGGANSHKGCAFVRVAVKNSFRLNYPGTGLEDAREGAMLLALSLFFLVHKPERNERGWGLGNSRVWWFWF